MHHSDAKKIEEAVKDVLGQILASSVATELVALNVRIAKGHRNKDVPIGADMDYIPPSVQVHATVRSHFHTSIPL